MSLPTLRHRAVLAALALLLAVAGVGTATGAIVEVDNIVLRADGGFQPQSLPRHRFAPIDFQGHLDISARDGGEVLPLRQAVIDFDRDGRLSVAGLPSCTPESIAEASTEEARRTCRGAIVGTGHLEVMVTFLDQPPTRSRSQLTIFNGPRLEGRPTAVLHTRLTAPATQTYAILVPIEKQRGEFRYRARFDVPPLAGGTGAITHVDIEIGRRYRAGGKQRSYVSARCSDNIIWTHGRFTFEDGTVIDGLVEKYCHSK
jgi:hypothetical protein